MKKTFFYFLTTLLCVLSITSCKEDEKPEYSENGVGVFNAILINGKGVSNNEVLTLSGNTPLQLTWEATRGTQQIKSIKITCNNNVITDYNGILWNGITTESLAQGGLADKWINTINLLPYSGTYVMTLTNMAGETTSFTFKIQGSMVLPGSPALSVQINGNAIVNYGSKTLPSGSLFTLGWLAVKGDSAIKDIAITYEGNEIYTASAVTEGEQSRWNGSTTLPVRAGTYIVTISTIDSLTQSTTFRISIPEEPVTPVEPSTLVGGVWKYSNTVAIINYPQGFVGGPTTTDIRDLFDLILTDMTLEFYENGTFSQVDTQLGRSLGTYTINAGQILMRYNDDPTGEDDQICFLENNQLRARPSISMDTILELMYPGVNSEWFNINAYLVKQ